MKQKYQILLDVEIEATVLDEKNVKRILIDEMIFDGGVFVDIRKVSWVEPASPNGIAVTFPHVVMEKKDGEE